MFYFHSTILHLAARFDTLDAVLLLLKTGADMYKLDQNGLNVIPYAAQSFYGKGLTFFLLHGVSVPDSPEMLHLFEVEDVFERLVLVCTYTDHPKLLLDRASKESKLVFRKFLDRYSDSKIPYPEAACVAYLEAKEPEWESDMKTVSEELAGVKQSSETLLSIGLEHFESVVSTTKDLVVAMGDFVGRYKKCRYSMNERQGIFGDFEPFITGCISDTERSLKFANEEDAEFLTDIWKNNLKSPMLHCVVSEKKLGELPRFKDFASKLLQTMKEKKDNIPDFDAFFNEKRQELKKIGLDLCNQFFAKLNTFYYAMHAKTATEFVRAELSSFVSFMVGTENQEAGKRAQEIQSAELELDQAINSFRLFCASMGLPLPKLNEEQSKYEMTSEEKSMAVVRQQLKETQEIEEKLAELNEGMEELRKYSSICTKCRKYCASYICPHCHVFLYCVLCKETGQTCPVCRKKFDEPVLINKTCFFGDEFEIKLRQEQAEERRRRGQGAPA